MAKVFIMFLIISLFFTPHRPRHYFKARELTDNHIIRPSWPEYCLRAACAVRNGSALICRYQNLVFNQINQGAPLRHDALMARLLIIRQSTKNSQKDAFQSLRRTCLFDPHGPESVLGGTAHRTDIAACERLEIIACKARPR